MLALHKSARTHTHTQLVRRRSRGAHAARTPFPFFSFGDEIVSRAAAVAATATSTTTRPLFVFSIEITKCQETFLRCGRRSHNITQLSRPAARFCARRKPHPEPHTCESSLLCGFSLSGYLLLSLGFLPLSFCQIFNGL